MVREHIYKLTSIYLNDLSRILIIEGLITIVYSVIAKFLIPDFPETAKFLTQHERVLVARRLEHDNGTGPARMDTLDTSAMMVTLSDWKIWVA